MQKLSKIVYTGSATCTGGRGGKVVSSDGNLNVDLSMPKALGGDGGAGTNPEQMFAGGYAACYTSALMLVASQQKVKLPENMSVTGEASLGPVDGGFALAMKLIIESGDLDKDKMQELADEAHRVCPYSNATRGNIDVTIEVN